MVSQEILRIEPLKSAEVAFQNNLISNFVYCFYNNFTIFSLKMSCFYCESLFCIQYLWILHLGLRLQLLVAIYEDAQIVSDFAAVND